MSDNKSTSSGIGFSGLLAIAFIVLKLCGVISWSWWWVLSPIWIPAIIIIGMLLFALIIGEYRRIKKKRKQTIGGHQYDPDGEVDLRSGKSKWEERLREYQKTNPQ